MIVPPPANCIITGNARRRLLRLGFAPVLCASLAFSPMVLAQSSPIITELQALTEEREILSRELGQYEKTLAVLQPDGTPPEESSNPAVRTLARETVRINERIIAIAEREVTLLQEQIVEAKAIAQRSTPDRRPEQAEAMESKPMRTSTRDFSAEQEKENVARLYELLSNHYTELQRAAETLPSDEELEQREAALRDARTLARIPFNADKVRLTGEEGSTALSQITQRLSDPNLPESRRDISPICSIKTRLFGSLIASENRSLKPVGKHHYVARIRLQPGDTTLLIQGDRWEVRLPQDVNTTEYVLTLYNPPGSRPELHVFAVNDLLAMDNPHIPAWLPNDMKLKPRAG
jgi:hypothetical protein